MVSKVIFSILVTLLVAQLATADNSLCPDKDKAKTLAYTEDVHEEAASSGRAEKSIAVPHSNKTITCITLTGIASAGTSGSVSIATVGVLDDGIALNLISGIKEGIDVTVEVYTE